MLFSSQIVAARLMADHHHFDNRGIAGKRLKEVAAPRVRSWMFRSAAMPSLITLSLVLASRSGAIVFSNSLRAYAFYCRAEALSLSTGLATGVLIHLRCFTDLLSSPRLSLPWDVC